jgi:hypothetical protein
MTMDARTLRASTTPPEGLSAPLTALWHAARGDWDKAHKIVQEDEGAEASWVHAWLHRVEGDETNAGHWYRRAGKPHATAPLDDEWAAIVDALVG